MQKLYRKLLKSFLRYGKKSFIPNYAGLMIYNPDLLIIVRDLLDNLDIAYDFVREYKILALPFIPSLVLVDDFDSEHLIHAIEAIKQAKAYPEYAKLFPILFAKDYPINMAHKAGFLDVIQLPFEYDIVSSLILSRVKYFFDQQIPEIKKPFIIGNFLVDYRIMAVINIKERLLISLTPTEFRLLIVVSFLENWWSKRELAMWLGKAHTHTIPLFKGNLSMILPSIIRCAHDMKYICKRKFKPLLLEEEQADKIIKKLKLRYSKT